MDCGVGDRVKKLSDDEDEKEWDGGVGVLFDGLETLIIMLESLSKVTKYRESLMGNTSFPVVRGWCS